MSVVAPFGSWPSIISAADVVAGASVPTGLWAADGIVWWSERRPEEDGREAVVRRDGDGTVHEVLPADVNARTRVHEYGGGAWWVHDETVFATRWDDQRVYRFDPGRPPRPVTPEPADPCAWRYADGRVTPDGRWVVCVRERHEGPDVATQVLNELVVFPADGSREPVVVFADSDFVAAPRVSRDGRQLAWLAWDHPNMPWDATQLWVGRLAEQDGLLQVLDARREAGGAGESLVQPEWGRHATLYVCSDRTGWWNVYRVDGVDRLQPVASVEAEVSEPAWQLGQSHYLVLADGTVAITHPDGRDTVLTAVAEDGSASTQRLVGQRVAAVAHDGTSLVGIVGSADRSDQVRRLQATDPAPQVLRPASGVSLPPGWVSTPTEVRFPTADGQHAFAWFYPPTNPEAQGEPGSAPPLLVRVHGGPTSQAVPTFSLGVQFWTSRGFAVADLNYRGSTGYGRGFRDQLRERWGIADVEDARALAAFLAAERRVDASRMAIRGGSAGGFTTLLATLLSDDFAAGVSYFGVTDIRDLVETTHKFESRYFDSMVGPWPETAQRYAERSPLTHASQARTPTLVLQGLEDAVVPPAQAEVMVAALRDKQVPHAYLPFEGEQHGFRKADNQVTALHAELSFYGQVFGVRPADDVPDLPLAFAENLRR